MRPLRIYLTAVLFLSSVSLYTLILAPSMCLARTWSVPSEIPTIQAAIDTAGVGDTVSVACGTYTWTGEGTGDADGLVHMASGVCLRSETGDPGCVTIDAEGLGRVIYCEFVDNAASIEGLTITGGAAVVQGGGIYLYQSSPAIRDCHITDNHLTDLSAQGAGLCCWVDCHPEISGCVISGNSLAVPGAGGGGGLTAWSGCDPTLTSCTFYDNRGDIGCQVLAWDNCDPVLDKCILAFGTYQQAVSCGTGSSITLTCSDVYGNEGGDWVDCIASQAEMNGNFSADPLFCEADSGDFRLMTDSPCISAPGCGQVGVYGHGCRQPNRWIVPLDAPTVQAGIDSAATGDTVVVKCGTYYESVVIDKNIGLMSETGFPDCVTIDGQNTVRCIECSNIDATAVIQGLRLFHGSADSGGGMYLVNSDPAVIDCLMDSCQASADGGGMCCMRSEPTLTGCGFTDNAAGGEAGGLYCGDSSSVTLESCVFTDNGATAAAGGMSVHQSQADLTDCAFSGNASADAGGMRCGYLSTVTLEGCVFDGNSSDDQGGAILTDEPTSLGITNCTLYGNSAANEGGGVHCHDASPSIGNTIIAFGADGDAVHCSGTSNPTLTCCDVYGNAGGDWVDCIAGQSGTNGNFSADPALCHAEGGDFGLHWTSPCLDTLGCGQVGAFGLGCVARTWHVSTAGDDSTGDGTAGNPFASVQHALGRAFWGDTVEVACGTYFEHDIIMKAGVLLTSQTGEWDCVSIDAEYTSRGFQCADLDSHTVIRGFRVMHGSNAAEGAGIHIAGSDVKVTNCRFGNCHASLQGGGMYIGESSPLLTNCFFDADSADGYGGAIHMEQSDAVLQDCIFTGNVSAVAGGAIDIADTSSAVFQVCAFELNSADSTGGAVMVCNSAAAFAYCGMRANTAGAGGAGIACEAADSLVLDNCLIYSNYAVERGGAVSAESTAATITACTFYDNSAGTSGGCIYCDSSTVSLEASIIAFGGGGGAVYCDGPAPSLSCCDVYGNAGGDWTGCIADQEDSSGNFSSDPVFCHPDEGNFYLRSGSPCLDAPGCGLVGPLGRGYCERTWLVPSEAPSIQAGVDSAGAGDTVLVACGTYVEKVTVKPGLYLLSETGEADCVTIDANSTGHVITCTNADIPVYIQGFTLTGGSGTSGGGLYAEYAKCDLVNCDISGNSTFLWGGGVLLRYVSEATFTNCRVSGNSALEGGGIIGVSTDVSLRDCVVEANSAGNYGGGIRATNSSVALSGCIVAGNSGGTSGGGIYTWDGTVTCDTCTFYGNDSPDGSGLWCRDTGVSLSNTIVAFGVQGAALSCDGVCSPTLACCDVFGNEGGDWVGCIAGQDTIYDNVSADPLFCDPDSGDFHVAGASICLSPPCGLIGALGAGCEDPMLEIISIEDVGNDQGRNVRMTWFRSSFDAEEDTIAITGYEVYRRQDAHLMEESRSRAADKNRVVPAPESGGKIKDERRHRLADGSGSRLLGVEGDWPSGQWGALNDYGLLMAPQILGWDYIGTVPAHGDSYYQYIAPTLCDSTVAGICWSVFFIRAASTNPFIYMDSPPDSGYSVDNLAPAPPPNLLMVSPTELEWDEVEDEDFNYYSVYGSAEPFLDETATLIGYTTDTTKDVTGHEYDYYHVTATDFAGNEGEESSIGNPYSGIPDPGVPEVFSLKQNRPNPFDATTVIGFDVPMKRHVSLTVFDARGRAVKVLTDEAYAPGRHSAVWDGTDEHGNVVAAGVYFVRMGAGDFKAMKKVMLLR